MTPEIFLAYKISELLLSAFISFQSDSGTSVPDQPSPALIGTPPGPGQLPFRP
jgi:hypothetical protein